MKTRSIAKPKGFTLIELLIVVAIIAILAAIAVPNFLEAQVRAKVSRVKADQRSIAVAIESYVIDSNATPMTAGTYFRATGQNVSSDYPFNCLTTPISYMTSIPRDPFVAVGGVIKKDGVQYLDYFDYVNIEKKVDGTYSAPVKAMIARGYTWGLCSIGPSRSKIDPSDPSKNVVFRQLLSGAQSNFNYDATNGTVSVGYIVRTNKGVFTGSDYKVK